MFLVQTRKNPISVAVSSYQGGDETVLVISVKKEKSVLFSSQIRAVARKKADG